MNYLDLHVRGRIKVVAWLSGSVLVLISGVSLRRARLILGWVTVYG